ncbi:IS66 family transposase [Bacteroides fragilis]|uniref:IS66 family transposase n=1 Tax=Bacteroides fragilis TaxID=817 RepID=UPI00202FE133|nr:IS66 family transposase [Bacteroides fragilis]
MDMDKDERNRILTSSKLLTAREDSPEPWVDPYSDMSSDEKSKLLCELMAIHLRDEKRNEELMCKIDELLEGNRQISDLKAMLLELENRDKSKDALIENQSKKITSLEEVIRLNNEHTYVSKSQKRKPKKTEDADHTKNKDDFDGTQDSLAPPSASSETTADKPDVESESHEKEVRLYRQGKAYRTMRADRSVCHACDPTKLPEGALIIKRMRRYSYEQVSSIIEHDYEVIRYKTVDGTIRDGYFPIDGEPEIMDVIPGTHASSTFMAYLAFNKYVLDTPLHREISRILDEDMRLSRMTLTNWLEKGSFHINKLIGFLKDRCLEKDAIVNCDETWCKVKVASTYRKRYLWCLVNKSEKIVIYNYEDGSRGRDVLRHILGDHAIKSLQSDGYNVYMYLDDNLIDIEHVCCMAHARAKFKYAFDQGGDIDACFFLDGIGELYGLEAEYEKGRLSAEQIQICRNNLKTKEIIIRLRGKLDALLSEGHPPRGELMEKAVHYLNTFWPQLFAYTHDGSYTIDNSIAERFIRPLAGERKNSLFFGSGKMAGVSAAYHTIISTCKMQGVPVLQYLKEFFKQIVLGRTDYENLLPMTIGITNNKH